MVGASAGRQVVALPTYAFQRQRYWLEAEKASGDVATMGQSSANHPLLGAATPLADSDAFLLTGRLSATEAGWLKDHAVFGTVLVPGTGLLELGFAAARAVGLTTVSQLTLAAPLVLPPEGAVRVQVQVDASGQATMASANLASTAGWKMGPKVRVDAARAGDAELGAEAAEGRTSRARDMAAAAGPHRPDGPLCNVAGSRVRLRSVVPGAPGSVAGWGYGVRPRVLPEALSSSAEQYGLHPALLDAARMCWGLRRSRVLVLAMACAAAVRVVGGYAGCERCT